MADNRITITPITSELMQDPAGLRVISAAMEGEEPEGGDYVVIRVPRGRAHDIARNLSASLFTYGAVSVETDLQPRPEQGGREGPRTRIGEPWSPEEDRLALHANDHQLVRAAAEATGRSVSAVLTRRSVLKQRRLNP